MFASRPISITDSILTSNIPEPDAGEQVWDNGTTYAQDDEVIVLSNHKKYRSVQGGNTGNDPLTDDETWWVEIGSSNRYAMFDNVIGRQSTESSNITVTFDAGVLLDSLFVFNVSATTANVTMEDPTHGTVYDNDIEMRDNNEVDGMYGYLTAPIVEKRRFSLWDLPAFPNAEVTLTLTSTGDVSCGECVIGQQVNLGNALLGSSIQQLNFNITERDAFGNITKTTGRRIAKLAKYNVHTPVSKSEYVLNTLDDLRDIAAVWSGAVDNDKTLIYGYHSDARINFSSHSIDDFTLEVEGLT